MVKICVSLLICFNTGASFSLISLLKNLVVPIIFRTFAAEITILHMYKEIEENVTVVENDETMDLEEARQLLHEMIDKEYSLP